MTQVIVQTTDANQVIEGIRTQLETMSESELQQANNKLPDLSDESRQVLGELAQQIVQRVIEYPQQALAQSDVSKQLLLVDTLQDLFELD